MSFRCINAFVYADRMYANGAQIEDGDPILGTHADHFAKVEESNPARAVEQAVATPGGLRSTGHVTKKAAPKKALAKPADDPASEDAEATKEH